MKTDLFSQLQGLPIAPSINNQLKEKKTILATAGHRDENRSLQSIAGPT